MGNASFQIVQIKNLRDGVRATPVIEASPTGGPDAMQFYAGRTPDIGEQERILLAKEPGELPKAPRLVFPLPGAWFVWGRDNLGWTKAPGAVFVGVSDRKELEETGIWLRDTVRRIQPLLDAVLVEKWGTAASESAPGTPPIAGVAGGSPTALSPRIKEVVYGVNALTRSYPAIVIHTPNWQEPYVGSGYLRQVTASFVISVMHLHVSQHSNMLPGLTAVMEHLQSVLNLPEYERITLPSGFRLATCNSVWSGNPNEDYLDGIGWAAQASLSWSGQTTTQRVTRL